MYPCRSAGRGTPRARAEHGLALEDSTISRSTHPSARPVDRSPSSLLSRCGLAGALALGILALPAAPALAQDKPAATPGSKEPPTNDPSEIIKRMKKEAEKQGIRTEAPQSVSPAPAPNVAPSALNQPQPVTAPGIQPGKGPDQPRKPGPGITPPTKGQPNTPPTPIPVVPISNPGLTAAPADTTGALHGDEFTFNFTEPVELTVLVTYVRDVLELQIIFMDGGLAGQKIYLNSPVTIKKKDVLSFLTMLLEQRDYTLVQDATGIFLVQPKADTKSSPIVAGQWGTTRIIRTPNIKPSTLQNSITSLLTAGRAGQAGAQPVYMDDLGLIIMTESPRVLSLVEDFVNTVVAERANLKFFRFELRNISAAAAKDRVLELLGQQTQRTTGGPAAGNVIPSAPPGAVGPGGSITNLGERITVDPTSNAIYLRGRDDERKLLTDLIAVVDLPNSMDSRWYPVGSKTAVAVAAQGRAEQLGTVSEFDFDSATRSSSGAGGGNRLGGAGGIGGTSGSNQDSIGSGAGFVLYPDSGGFIYRGTEVQHERVKALIKNLVVISADEETTYQFYKLRHGKSTDVAEIIQNLLSGSSGSGNRGGLLGGDLGRRTGSTARRTPQPAAGTRTGATPTPANPTGAAAGAGGAGGLSAIEGADVYVLADEPNNQVLVKAPAKLQHQFRELIGKIDLRRPQVYIDAKIVVVNSTDSFRLAVEAQQIIGQFAFNTNFGLGSLGSTSTGTPPVTTGGFTSPKTVATGLGGITAALIRSKDVPFVVNALSSTVEGRIVATPQLLVDDNEEAEISSLDQQPTGVTTSPVGGQQTTGFQDYQSAGPKLTVTPQISEGGYLRLKYNIELSSFTGAPSGNLPPPKLENKIKSDAVTVPTDATIVVGGLTFTQTGNTIVRVPLLGDIPLLGNLFKDTSKTGRVSTLYVFITPKIMRDPSFADLRLLTRSPLAEVGVPAENPPPLPEAIPVIDTARFMDEQRLRDEREKHKVAPEVSPAKGPPVHKDPPVSDEPR